MKQTYLYGAMALGLLFTSCSSDDIIDNVNTKLEADQDFYVSVRISGDGISTRAASQDGTPVLGEKDDDPSDFANGTGTESFVQNVFFVFYDANGNVVGDVTSIDVKNEEWKTDNVNGTVEKYYKSVVKFSVAEGEGTPTQVICYINPVNNGNLNRSLNEIQTLALTSAVKDGDNGSKIFPMSNSVYYLNDAATEPEIAVPLTQDVNLFKTEAEAEAANEDNKCAEIYVERYASKLSFNATEANQTPFVTGQRIWKADGTEDDSQTITLTFEPQYWAVNAEAKQTYVIKSFREQSPDGYLMANNYTYTGLNDIINKELSGENVWKWNAPGFHRSYWGMSPAYFTNKYPEVSSDLDPNHSELQKYISYNELKNGKKGYGANVTTSQYFKETTVGSLALASKNPAAAVASVIYVGRYKIKIGEDETLLEDKGFYTYLNGPVKITKDSKVVEVERPYIYFENETGKLQSKVDGTESMLKRFLVQASILYKKVPKVDEDGNNVVDSEGNQEYTFEPYQLGNGTGFNGLLDVVEIAELGEAEKANYSKPQNPSDSTEGDSSEEDTPTSAPLKLQHNARTLQFKGVPAADKNVYVLTYDGYKTIVTDVEDEENEISLVDANIALARNVGFALYYTKGHAYFNIPVKHFGWYRKGNPNANKTEIDWEDVRVGDFGMVRNHSYSINVSKIEGLASGIGGDDVELVPPSFKQDYFLSYTINILKWALVPTQEVDL